jgi:chromosome segregation ATPase
MFRKLSLAAVGVIGLGLVMYGVSFLEYCRGGFQWVKEQCRGAVPIELEVARATSLISDLAPRLRAHLRLLSEAEVELEETKVEIADTERAVSQDREKVLAMRRIARGADGFFDVEGKHLCLVEFKDEIGSAFQGLLAREESLKALRATLAAKEKRVAALREDMTRMRREGTDLRLKVEQLKSQLASVESIRKSGHEDGSNSSDALEKTREAVRLCAKRIAILSRYLVHEGRLSKGLVVFPTDPLETANILERIDEHFGLDSADNAALAGAQRAGKAF